MTFNLRQNSIVYVLCPANIQTGGTELLHQLVCALNKKNIKSYIVYFGDKSKFEISTKFSKYLYKYLTIDEINDTQNNYLITPEVSIYLLKRFSFINKVIWWLSVDNAYYNLSLKYRMQQKGIINAIVNIFLNRYVSFEHLKSITYHLCQSHYAIDFLKKKGIESSCIEYLSDYISEDYLVENIDTKRDNIVLYNPKKGYEYTKNIISKLSSIECIPLTNFDISQLRQLYLKSKVYIDFGNHPGKDRIPREAAALGCIVITNRKGAAKFDEDVPIPEYYKINNLDSETFIINKINSCIENYKDKIKDFESYRKIISNEKENFYKTIDKLFRVGNV